MPVAPKSFRAGTSATDDASLVENLGVPVHTVAGDPLAFKITTPLDLLLAEAEALPPADVSLVFEDAYAEPPATQALDLLELRRILGS